MVGRRPLVALIGATAEMPTGDVVPVAAGGTGATNAAGALAALGLNAAAVVSFRNRIINGNLAINQRGAPAASTAYSAGTFLMDRFKAGSGGVTMSFSTAASGDVTATITAGTLVQVMEGKLAVPEGGTFTLSWSGTATARVYQGTASGSYAASPIMVTGLTAGSNTTVEFSTGTIGLVQFEPGAVATVFERRDDELYRCQRYFASFGGFDAYEYFASGGFYTANNFYFAMRMPVRMRAAPTLTVANPTVFAVLVNGALNNVSSFTADHLTPDTAGLIAAATGAQGAAGTLISGNSTFTRLQFSADL